MSSEVMEVVSAAEASTELVSAELNSGSTGDSDAASDMDAASDYAPVTGKAARALAFRSRESSDRKRSGGHAGHGPARDQKAIFVGADDNLLAVVNVRGEDQFGQGILHILLDYPLQGPRPIGWIVALGRKPGAGLRPQFESDLAARPITGSSFPARAASVRSRAYFFKAS
jgi:hypothetical protein